MKNKGKVEIYFTEHLKKDGFKKSRKFRTWFKKTTHGDYFSINLQKSRLDDSFYFNIGIKYLGLNEMLFNENDPLGGGDTGSRAEMYISEEDNENSELFNIMSGGVDNTSDELKIKAVYEYICGFFNKNSIKEKFKKNYKEYYMLDNVGISEELEKFCECYTKPI